MKYWIFQNNEVCGPYEPDDLSQLPGYSSEALVCPEGRKGTRMGDWQRANMVPALALSLVKTAQLAAAGSSGSSASAIYSGLPSEPTLKDLAALGSLQEKIALLENTVAQFQEGLHAKEAELLSLHREIDLRKGIEAAFQDKIREFEARLVAVSQLREAVDNAIVIEKSMENEVKGVESSVQEVKTSMTGVSGVIKELEGSLEKQHQAVNELMAEIERLKTGRAAPLPQVTAPFAQTESPAAPPAAPVAFPPPLGIERFGAPAPAAAAGMTAPEPAPLQLNPPSLAAPAPAPLFPGQEAAASLFSPFDGASGGAAPEVSSFSPAKDGLPEAAAPETPPAGSPAKDSGSATPAEPPAPTPASKPAAAILPAVPPRPKPSPKPSRRGLIAAVICCAVAVVGGLAFQAGLLPGRHQKPVNPAAAPPAPAEVKPPPPSPEEQAAALSSQAIALVQSWPAGDKTSTVGQQLAAFAPPAGGLSPWMAEKLGADSFQVNFYGSKATAGGAQHYDFQANLAEKTVVALNDAAKALLAGPPPARAGRRVRVKPKQAAAAKAAAAKHPDALPGFDRTPQPSGGNPVTLPGADNRTIPGANEKRTLPGANGGPLYRPAAAATSEPAEITPAPASATPAPAVEETVPPAPPPKKAERTAPRRQGAGKAAAGKNPTADDAQLLDQILE